MSDLLPEIRTPVPGPRSMALGARLARVECPEVTCLEDAPIFWEQACGANVTDVDGNRYVDLLSGFGVASLGYAHAEVVEVWSAQAR
ncbi:MAG: aminotransferase class III-fold pyridoxal phosphate-dependent enzyme, partial [Myxococcota bacterium]